LAELVAKKRRFAFIGDTIDELKKVTWLKWPQEVVYLSVLVMVVAVAVGLIMGGVDFVFNYLINTLFIGG
jgi:preprotein translocase SecE subunit